jgi:hypothetical protein
MKKVLIIGLIVGLALVLIGGAGVVFARVQGVNNTPELTITASERGVGIVREFNYGPGGMMPGYVPGSVMQRYIQDGVLLDNGNGTCPGGDGFGYGPGGMMGGRGNACGRGMIGGRGIARGEGLMHEYMIAAFADALNLTADEIESRLEDGETLKEIAIAQGTTEEQLPDLFTQVQQAALDQAVADGVITQVQADFMLERMNNYDGEGFGPGYNRGNCPMWDGDEAQQP